MMNKSSGMCETGNGMAIAGVLRVTRSRWISTTSCSRLAVWSAITSVLASAVCLLLHFAGQDTEMNANCSSACLGFMAKGI